MSEAHQLLLTDLVYLGVAAGLGLWFRAWLRRQQRAMDERLSGLEARQAQLDRLAERLQSVCRGLEGVFARAARQAGEGGEAGRAPGEPRARWSPASRGRPEGARAAGAEASGEARPVGGRGDDPYRRARELLRQGVAPAEVARKVGLGMAEVNVLRHMEG